MTCDSNITFTSVSVIYLLTQTQGYFEIKTCKFKFKIY